MTNQELIDSWSKQYGKPVIWAEVEAINRNLSNFFNILLRWKEDFKAKGLLDENRNIVEK